MVADLPDSARPETLNGFPVDPPVLVRDWHAFAEWAHDAGYDESWLNWRDSKCLALQEQYLQELEELELESGSTPTNEPEPHP